MSQRNVVKENPLRRYIFRRDFVRKVSARLADFVRLTTKDAFSDQQFLFQDRTVTTILDVGANIGHVTSIYKRRFPVAQIYALEPSPETYYLLEKNYRGESNVHTYQYAVSNTVGETEFNVNFNSGTSSVFRPSAFNGLTWAHKGTKERVQVPCTTITSFCAEVGINNIDVLKLDIEGSELNALEGAVELLKSSAIWLIYTEVTLLQLYERQPLFHNITSFLETHDYWLYNIYPITETFIKQGTITNAIYLSPRLREVLMQKWGADKCGW